MISAPRGAPRCVEASIADMGAARYDGHAEWHDRELATAAPGLATRAVAARLLGHGGRLLDVGYALERVEEAGREDDGYPFILALRARC